MSSAPKVRDALAAKKARTHLRLAIDSLIFAAMDLKESGYRGAAMAAAKLAKRAKGWDQQIESEIRRAYGDR